MKQIGGIQMNHHEQVEQEEDGEDLVAIEDRDIIENLGGGGGEVADDVIRGDVIVKKFNYNINVFSLLMLAKFENICCLSL